MDYQIIENEFGVFRVFNEPEQLTNGILNFDEEMIYLEASFDSKSKLLSYCLFYGDILIEDFDVFRRYYIKEKGSNVKYNISPFEYNTFKIDSKKASQALTKNKTLVMHR